MGRGPGASQGLKPVRREDPETGVGEIVAYRPPPGNGRPKTASRASRVNRAENAIRTYRGNKLQRGMPASTQPRLRGFSRVAGTRPAIYGGYQRLLVVWLQPPAPPHRPPQFAHA